MKTIIVHSGQSDLSLSETLKNNDDDCTIILDVPAKASTTNKSTLYIIYHGHLLHHNHRSLMWAMQGECLLLREWCWMVLEDLLHLPLPSSQDVGFARVVALLCQVQRMLVLTMIAFV